MNKILITQGGTPQGWSRWNDLGIRRDYNTEAKRLIYTALPYDFNMYIVRNNESIKNSSFYIDHRDVLDKDSFGTAFKPLGFWELLNSSWIYDGDVILWVDSNHAFRSDPKFIIDRAIENGIYTHNHQGVTYLNKNWTLRGMFVGMGCDEEYYWNSIQVQCNVIAICKCNKTMEFCKEFLTDSLNYDIMFGIGEYQNFPEFREHRHEQSIFSILIEKYQIPIQEYPKEIVELDGINVQS